MFGTSHLRTCLWAKQEGNPHKASQTQWLQHEKSTRHTYKTWHTCNNIFKHYSVITNHLLWSDRFNVLSVLGFSPKRQEPMPKQQLHYLPCSSLLACATISELYRHSSFVPTGPWDFTNYLLANNHHIMSTYAHYVFTNTLYLLPYLFSISIVPSDSVRICVRGMYVWLISQPCFLFIVFVKVSAINYLVLLNYSVANITKVQSVRWDLNPHARSTGV